VAQQLRATSCPTALIIALTGWGQETDRHRSARAGMNVHLVKPVDPAHIGRLLQGSASGEITAAQA
jgi:CheY-like chemotaxis protein